MEDGDFEVPDPPRIHKVACFLRKYYGSVKGTRVLECGVARGGLADVLSKEGAHCLGLDINSRNIPGVNCIRADLNYGFPTFDEPFNVIFAGELIEHLYDDLKFLKESYRNLYQGGLLIVTVPNLLFSINRFRMLFGLPPLFAYKTYHYHLYTKTIIKNIIQGAGFNILKTSSSHILFSTRLNKVGRIFEILGDIFPSIGAHIIIFAKKP